MHKALQPLVKRFLELSGLIGPLHRRVERRLARETGVQFDDGLPMPPDDLLVGVSGTADQRWFSERGCSDAQMFSQLALKYGADIKRGVAVLDLGCGCGRLARWLAPEIIEGGGSFIGSDFNRNLISWCRGKLPGIYLHNKLPPPLQIPDESIDVIYAYSVFTHLSEQLVKLWFLEVNRVLKRGGLAMITFHDEIYATRWGPEGISARVKSSGYVVLNDALEGSNYMSSWTTLDYFSALASRNFEVLDILPGCQDAPVQAISILRKA